MSTQLAYLGAGGSGASTHLAYVGAGQSGSTGGQLQLAYVGAGGGGSQTQLAYVGAGSAIQVSAGQPQMPESYDTVTLVGTVDGAYTSAAWAIKPGSLPAGVTAPTLKVTGPLTAQYVPTAYRAQQTQFVWELTVTLPGGSTTKAQVRHVVPRFSWWEWNGTAWVPLVERFWVDAVLWIGDLMVGVDTDGPFVTNSITPSWATSGGVQFGVDADGPYLQYDALGEGVTSGVTYGVDSDGPYILETT